MSAHRVAGIDPITAGKMDTFWASLSHEHRAALHIAFNLSNHRPGYESNKHPEVLLRNAGSGHDSVGNVEGAFLRFLEQHLESEVREVSAESVLAAILEYGTLSGDEQQKLIDDATVAFGAES